MKESFSKCFSWLTKHPRGILCFFLLQSVVLYGTTLFGEFVYDDGFFTQNGSMRDPWYLLHTWMQPSLKGLEIFPHYRPLTFFTFSLNFLLFGESPFSFHVVSIAVNGLTCWMVFVLMEKLFKNRALSWITAVYFALLPIHTEAIAYMKARDELFVAFFGLLGWLAFLKAEAHPAKRLGWSLASAFALLCAFLSKESALIVPGAIGITQLFLRGWKGVLKSWLSYVLIVCAMVTFFLMHGIAAGFDTIPNKEFLYFGQNPLGYLPSNYVPWTGFALFFIALGKTFVPWNLSAVYGFAHIPIIGTPFGHWLSPAGMAVLLCLLACIALPRLRRSPVGVGAAVFLVLYFPFSKILFYHGIDFFAERWLYAPSIGLSMMAGYIGWLVWSKLRAHAPVIFTCVIVAYLFILLPRNFDWRNELALGESMVRDAPNSVIGYVFLGNKRLQYGQLEEAANLVTKGLRITRDHMPIHHIAASVAMSMDRMDVAEKAISTAEQLSIDDLSNVIIRSTLLAKQHRYEESLAHLRTSRWFMEYEPRTRMLLALNLWMLGKHEEAKQYFDWDRFMPGIKMTDEEKILMFEMY